MIMLYFFSSYKLQRFIRKYNIVVFILSSLLIFYILFLIYPKEEMAVAARAPLVDKKEEKKDYSKIGFGPLALYSKEISPQFSHIQKEVMVLGMLTRPDKTSPLAQVLVGIKGSLQKKIVGEGEKCFLGYIGAQDQLSFSEAPSLLSISPRKEMGKIRFFVECNELEKTELDLKMQTTVPGEVLSSRPFQAIQGAKAWGPDRLLQEYGGPSYSAEKYSYQIDFLEDGLSSVVYITAGDYLSWDGKRWHKTPLSEALTEAPLAYVKMVSMNAIELDIWDESGFYSLTQKILVQHPLKVQSKIEEVFTSLRLKTATQVSAFLGKRRVVLKKGDWWIKSGKGWHSVKTLGEINAVLDKTMSGELFVVDDIEKWQGKTYLKGRLFDERRSNLQHVTLSISDKKTTPKLSKSINNFVSQTPAKSVEERNQQYQEDENWEKMP